MTNAKYLLASAYLSNQNKMNVTSNNIANANTNGFKADSVAFASILKNVEYIEGAENNSRNFMEDALTYIDFKDGGLQNTGNKFDLAIQGDGFLTVSDANNNDFYTDNGSMFVDADGILRSTTNHTIHNIAGDVIFIPEEIANFDITETGEIIANDEIIDQIKIVSFENKNQIDKIGDNLFSSKELPKISDPTTYKIIHRAVETSNVNSFQELTNLMSTVRHIEEIMAAQESLSTISSNALDILGRWTE